MMADQINSEISYDLPSLLNEALAKGHCKEALLLIHNPQYNLYFEEGSAWDLIPIVSKYVTRKTFDKFPDLEQCCEELLAAIGIRAHPEESLLEFMDNVECIENNVLFIALLKPMQTCLSRKEDRGNFLQFCLNSIEYHIVNQSIPEMTGGQEDGNKQVDTDLCYKEITDLYLAAHTFCKPFVCEITHHIKMSSEVLITNHVKNERQSLVCFILQLLGKPLVCFDLSTDNPKTTARVIAESVVCDLANLTSNLLMFLEYTELREIQERQKFLEESSLGEDIGDVFLLDNKAPTISIAVLYYLIYGEEVNLDRVPCVYNPLYLLQISLYLATKLLQEHDAVVEKGLKFAEKALSRVQDFEVPYRMLELAVNEQFVQVLAFTIIYCPHASLRQLALKTLKSYIFKFDIRGRYLLMCNMHRGINHSSLLGFLIMELKEIIDKAMSMEPIPPYFCGKSLFALLKIYCFLPVGLQGDIRNLLDNSAQITASLNLLRFFIIKDKKNVTGIWDYVASFEEMMLEPLRVAIDLSRESNKLELQKIQKGNNTGPPERAGMGDVNLTVTVGGKGIPFPEQEEKHTVQQINDSLNIIDMMASLLFRLKECIQYSPLQQ